MCYWDDIYKGISCMNVRLTAALLVAVVRAVPLLVAHLVDVDALARLAHELPRGARGHGAVAHALHLVRAVLAVGLAVAHVPGGHTRAVLAGELVAGAGVVRAAALVAPIPAVVHAVTARLGVQPQHIILTHAGLRVQPQDDVC